MRYVDRCLYYQDEGKNKLPANSPLDRAVVPIVLTGTIIPNAIKVIHCDSTQRRREYLEAIRFYKKYSKVYFLENSAYDLSHDKEFLNDEKFQWIKFKQSKEYERGKGYQEFQMLDKFVKECLCEDSFIKITGRYVYDNFDKLFSFILRKKNKYEIIIDSFTRKKLALTSLFYIRKNIYLARFLNSYLEMNDSNNVWAEHIIYSRLKNVSRHTFFPRTPVFQAVDSSTGFNIMPINRSLMVTIKNAQRELLMMIGAKNLLI